MLYTKVGEIAALQATAMLTTPNVGRSEEDESMAAMRGILSKINALGFVTVDSQTGRKENRPTHWQRAYISGFVPRHMSDKFVVRMNMNDSIIALAFPHGEEQPLAGQAFAWKRMPRLALTVEARFETCTSQPLAIAQPFESMWKSMLPELQLRDDRKSMTAVAKDAVQIFVLDTVWGRKSKLFDVTRKCLFDINNMDPYGHRS